MSLLGDIFARVRSVLNLKDFFNAIDPTGDIANGCNGVIRKFKGAEEDNIVPPEGSATLSGALYGDLQNAIPSYCLNMTGANFQSDTQIAPDQLSPTRRVAYDMVLLSKQAACTGVDSYTSSMAFYRNYCKDNGIDYYSALSMASMELQSEAATYNGKANQAVGKIIDAAHARDISCTAHSLLLQANPDFQDQPLRGIEAYGLSYEGTLNSSIPISIQESIQTGLGAGRTGIEGAPEEQTTTEAGVEMGS